MELWQGFGVNKTQSKKQKNNTTNKNTTLNESTYNSCHSRILFLFLLVEPPRTLIWFCLGGHDFELMNIKDTNNAAIDRCEENVKKPCTGSLLLKPFYIFSKVNFFR